MPGPKWWTFELDDGARKFLETRKPPAQTALRLLHSQVAHGAGFIYTRQMQFGPDLSAMVPIWLRRGHIDEKGPGTTRFQGEECFRQAASKDCMKVHEYKDDMRPSLPASEEEFCKWLKPFFQESRDLSVFDRYILDPRDQAVKVRGLGIVCRLLLVCAPSGGTTLPCVNLYTVRGSGSTPDQMVAEIRKARPELAGKLTTRWHYVDENKDTHCRMILGRWWGLLLDKGVAELGGGPPGKVSSNNPNAVIHIFAWPTEPHDPFPGDQTLLARQALALHRLGRKQQGVEVRL